MLRTRSEPALVAWRRLLVWIALILFLVLPWRSFEPRMHWDNVRWIPFGSPPFRVRDIVLNVLLYVPLGYWHVRSGHRSIWRAGLFAVLLSAATEALQLFSYRRFPSTTDISTNLIGAISGAIWAGARFR